MHFSKLSISSFSMFIIAINIFTGSMGLLAYHLFGQNRHVFVIQLFFLLVLLPIDSFLIAHKWYPFQHTFGMYVIRVGIYFSFIFLVDGVQTSIAGYGMMFSLEQYHQIERWLIQYPMLPFLLYFVYLVGLDSGIRYGYTKLSSKCSFKPTAI